MATFQVALILSFDTAVVKSKSHAEQIATLIANSVVYPYARYSNSQDIYVDTKYDDLPVDWKEEE